jgi:hypothetical protein
MARTLVLYLEVAALGAVWLSTTAAAQDGSEKNQRFFNASYVDYWGSGPKSKADESKQRDDYTDAIVTDDGRVESYRPPQAVVDLLQSPTEENARKYLAWQRERLRRVAAAVKAVRDADDKAPEEPLSVKVTYFTRAGCPACAKQDVEIKKLSGRVATVIEIDDPDVLQALGIDAVPTLVISDPASGRRRVLTGFHDAQAVLSAARELAGGKDESR